MTTQQNEPMTLERLQEEKEHLLAVCQIRREQNASLALEVEAFREALEKINNVATKKRKAHSRPQGCSGVHQEMNFKLYQIATEFKKLALDALSRPPIEPDAVAKLVHYANVYAHNGSHGPECPVKSKETPGFCSCGLYKLLDALGALGERKSRRSAGGEGQLG